MREHEAVNSGCAKVRSLYLPNTEKRMQARRRRRSAFITVSRCLEPLMKTEARVFEWTSKTSVRM